VKNPLHFEGSASPAKRWLSSWNPKNPLWNIIDEIPSLKDGNTCLTRIRLAEKIAQETRTGAIGILSVHRRGERLIFDQVPGIHDVTTVPGYGFDVFDNFSAIIREGFQGGPYCNVHVPNTSSYREHFPRREYKGRTASRGTLGAPKVVTSDYPQFHGDRYRLVLWTGFSNNFVFQENNSQATVIDCPRKDIEPFVVFDSAEITAETIQNRIHAYQEHFGSDLLTFIDRAQNWETVEEL